MRTWVLMFCVWQCVSLTSWTRLVCVTLVYNMLSASVFLLFFHKEQTIMTASWGTQIWREKNTKSTSAAFLVVVLVVGGFVFEDLGRMFNNSFPTWAFFFFFFKVGISSRALIPLFRPGSVHSGSASWDDCDQVFLDELCVSLFPDRYYAWTVPTSTSFGQSCMCV